MFSLTVSGGSFVSPQDSLRLLETLRISVLFSANLCMESYSSMSEDADDDGSKRLGKGE